MTEEKKRDYEGDVMSHYGVDKKFAIAEYKKIFAGFMSGEKYSDVLDENFPEMKAEQRAKIINFAIAFAEYQEFQDFIKYKHRKNNNLFPDIKSFLGNIDP